MTCVVRWRLWINTGRYTRVYTSYIIISYIILYCCSGRWRRRQREPFSGYKKYARSLSLTPYLSLFFRPVDTTVAFLLLRRPTNGRRSDRVLCAFASTICQLHILYVYVCVYNHINVWVCVCVYGKYVGIAIAAVRWITTNSRRIGHI